MYKKHTARLRKPQAILVVLIFTALGTYIITRSFAAVTVCSQTLAGGSNAATNNTALQSAVSGANTVTTICLGAGNYGTFNGATKTNMVTISPTPGLTPSQVTMKLNFNNATNLAIDGVKLTDGKPDNVDPGQPGQACTPSNVVPGGTCGTPGQAAQLISGTISGGKNITIKNSDLPGMMTITSNAADANVLLDTNIHHDFNAYGCSCPEGRVIIFGSKAGTGITVQNSQFIRGRSDGIQVGAGGVKIINNVMKDFIDGVSDGVHTDAIQFTGNSSKTLVKGNFFYDTGQTIAGFDGTEQEIIEDNVVVTSGRPYAIELLSDNGSIIQHNTLPNFSAAGGCYWEVACGIIRLGNKSGDPVSTGTIIKDNIASSYGLYAGTGSGGGTGITPSNQSNNLFALSAGDSGHSEFKYSTADIRGLPIYVGGANPMTYADFALAAGSLGKGNASDGLDRGVRFGTTPPPGPVVGELDASPPVNGHDLSLLLSKFNTTYAQYDLDNTPPITGHDLSLLLSNWGR